MKMCQMMYIGKGKIGMDQQRNGGFTGEVGEFLKLRLL